MCDTTYCLGGRPYSQTINESQVERINPKTKRKKTIRGQCAICGRNKFRILTK